MSRVRIARFEHESDDEDLEEQERIRDQKRFVYTGLVGTIVIVALTGGFIAWDVYVMRFPKLPTATDGIFEHGSVSCDAPYCADIGKKMLERGGSVADSAIATLLCMGVVHSQSLGIGGGFIMVLYNATTQKSSVLNARETAPAAATQNMFQGDSDKSRTGGLSVAVPGEIAGYWKLHKVAGRLPWNELFQPTIELCEKGYQVTKHKAQALNRQSELILKEPSMREIFVNSATNKVYQEGDTIKRTDLIPTLKRIAEGGAYEFYQGETGQRLVEDLQQLGGIITMDDMKSYQAEWQAPLEMKVFGDFTLHTVPPSGSGVLLAFILKVVGNYQFHSDALREGDQERIRIYQTIVEAFKHAFAKRTELGDPLLEEGRHVYDVVKEMLSNEYINKVINKIDVSSTKNTAEFYGAKYYQPDDHGTGHVSIIGSDGDAIAITSTINLYFGALIRSNRTGIIYNDQMDDFSAPNIVNYFGVPPSPNNFIQPGKRPLSSMTPAIFTDSMGRVKLVIGTAGGTNIPTATALVSMKNLWFGQNIKKAVEARRIHHQLFPMSVRYERDFEEEVVNGLKEIGHNVTEVGVGSSIVTAVARECDGRIHATSDFRKQGTIAGF